MVAYTDKGKVYSWGVQIGQIPPTTTSNLDYTFCSSVPVNPPSVQMISTPILVPFPPAIEISEVACGTSHCLALSKDGKVGNKLANLYIISLRIQFNRFFFEREHVHGDKVNKRAKKLNN